MFRFFPLTSSYFLSEILFNMVSLCNSLPCWFLVPTPAHIHFLFAIWGSLSYTFFWNWGSTLVSHIRSIKNSGSVSKLPNDCPQVEGDVSRLEVNFFFLRSYKHFLFEVKTPLISSPLKLTPSGSWVQMQSPWKCRDDNQDRYCDNQQWCSDTN